MNDGGTRRTPSSAPAVLLVEDHEDSRDVLCQVLEYEGCRVGEASTAQQAVDMAHTTAFDVVVTDISLHGSARDGVWLLRRLQRMTPAPAVVAMTGHKEREHELQRLGFAAVLIKPIDALGLGAIVRRVATR